jgi:hypothetical protein
MKDALDGAIAAKGNPAQVSNRGHPECTGQAAEQ